MKDKTQLSFKDLRGIRFLDGRVNIIPKGHKKQVEILIADIDVIHALVQPVEKVYSTIKATKVAEQQAVAD